MKVCAICRKRVRAEDIVLVDGQECSPCCSMGGMVTIVVESTEPENNYARLHDVLATAEDQAAGGKGKERHADDQPFEDQPIQWIEEHFKSFQLGQAAKKMHESQRLPEDAAIKELLGAINYLAARVIYLQDHKPSK